MEKHEKPGPTTEKKHQKKDLSKKMCDRCKTRTPHEQTTEGVYGYNYYLDYTCDVCGCVQSVISNKAQPHIVTEYTWSSGTGTGIQYAS